MKPGSALRLRLRCGLVSACIASLVAGSALAQTSSTHVTAVRFWSFGEVTRVAIETDGEARYHAERIDLAVMFDPSIIFY